MSTLGFIILLLALSAHDPFSLAHSELSCFQSSILGLQAKVEDRNNIKAKGQSAGPTYFLQRGTEELLWIN